jgi:hypothetical protein
MNMKEIELANREAENNPEHKVEQNKKFMFLLL